MNTQCVIVDGSVVVKWYLPEVYTEEALNLLLSEDRIVISEFAVAQLGMVLSKRVKTNEVKADLARQILANVRRLAIQRVPVADIAEDALEIAAMSGRTFTESIGLALAIREKTKLVTADHRWFTLLATSHLRHHVRFISEYAI